MNIWPLIVSTLLYFFLGSLWFSLLFGKIWAKEVEKHGVKIKEPTKKQLSRNMLSTLALNFLVVLGVGLIVSALGVNTFLSGLRVGLLLGICFTLAPLGVCNVWEGRSLKLTLLDAGYPMLGIVTSCIIFALWK